MMAIEEKFFAFDEDGNKYEIFKWVGSFSIGTIDDPHARKRSLPVFKLSDGRFVNQKDKDTYEIVQTSEILKRKD